MADRAGYLRAYGAARIRGGGLFGPEDQQLAEWPEYLHQRIALLVSPDQQACLEGGTQWHTSEAGCLEYSDLYRWPPRSMPNVEQPVLLARPRRAPRDQFLSSQSRESTGQQPRLFPRPQNRS